KRIGSKRNDRDGGKRERQGHERREKIRELVHTRRRGIFLQEKFRPVSQWLQQSVRPDPMRSPTRLHVRHDFAFEPRQIGIDGENDEKKESYLYDRYDHHG